MPLITLTTKPDWQTTYRGYHALYSELDVARAYNPADAIATLQPATA